ncbi:hypothetical protein QF205_01110 [Luteimonas composti]|uniref:Uncharacterized protein n=1 Tax=Luteimonas composti TaxID=398257 RepID=A0ABT6MM93_9GAMM|nr:hypothetical protein [Luteimonas composti]MDH7451679.1 hypothetical protein [Luteimonas composti]
MRPSKGPSGELAALRSRAIELTEVRVDGPTTRSRGWGVYRLPEGVGGTRAARYGNHPVRMQELQREFGSCRLEALFLAREDARALATAMNGEPA